MQIEDRTMKRLKYQPRYEIIHNQQGKYGEKWELCRLGVLIKNGKKVPASGKILFKTHHENLPWLEAEADRLNREARAYFSRIGLETAR